MIFRVSPVIALVGLATLAYAQAISVPDVPDKIKAPAGDKVVLLAHASGSQIYACRQGSSPVGKLQWALKAPEAVLRDPGGAVIGHHYAGPTWKHNDGSEVSGKAVAQVDSPDADSIPWLLVAATAHSGSGVFAHVETIQRIHTKGGGPPPASDCDASRLNAEKKISYTADYYFYVSGE
jgi:hypothetical protein